MRPAEEKALSFFVLIAIGYALRPKLHEKSALAGVRALVLNALLPAVIFVGLTNVRLSFASLGFPLLNAAHIVVQLLAGSLIGRLVLPGASRANERSTLALLSSSFAPGLSAFVFVKEFAPSGMAMGALMDLASKAYLLGLAPALMRAAHGGAPAAKPRSLAEAARRELSEPLSASIVAGLAMSAAGLSVRQLGPLGEAISRLEAAQTPILFLFIGLTVSLDGAAPFTCGSAVLARGGVAQLFAWCAVRALGLVGETALALVIMLQSACSVVAYAQLEKVASAISAPRAPSGAAARSGGGGAVDGEAACALPLALDLVGYSFPLAIVLNTAAGLLRERYVELLPALAPGLLVAAVAVALAGRRTSAGAAKPTGKEL
ncbi:hypothetical protein KFE25_010881 [Diacronema lutheri]|uniref:Uncharacterized protein n=1 Tax=Diacronema lutheri TaxID=2081491 RepID=A0A8J5X4M4_DIALT|nr:hypothetical protein KFE25_010881 [Diacronema lutheri]